MKKNCSSEHVPVSISTDRDLSLLNALKTELPEVQHFLCCWHISRKFFIHNIPKVFKGLESDLVKTILVNWDCVVSFDTEQEYAKNLAALIKDLPKKNSQAIVYDPSLFENWSIVLLAQKSHCHQVQGQT